MITFAASVSVGEMGVSQKPVCRREILLLELVFRFVGGVLPMGNRSIGFLDNEIISISSLKRGLLHVPEPFSHCTPAMLDF